MDASRWRRLNALKTSITLSFDVIIELFDGGAGEILKPDAADFRNMAFDQNAAVGVVDLIHLASRSSSIYSPRGFSAEKILASSVRRSFEIASSVLFEWFSNFNALRTFE